MRFSFIAAQSGSFPISWLFRRLGVSGSSYYAGKNRRPSLHWRDDERLRLKVIAYHRRSFERYGSPCSHDDLLAEGERVSRERVARLMREMGLYGRLTKRWKKTTLSKHRKGYAPNPNKQNFHADRPNALWMADIRYNRTWAGWMFLAVVIDGFSRKVVVYAVDDHVRSDLALKALDMAILFRSPLLGLIQHSDRGIQ